MAKPAGPPSSSAAPPGKEEEEQKKSSGGGSKKRRRRGGKGALIKQVVEAWAEDSLDLRRFQGKRVRGGLMLGTSPDYVLYFLQVGWGFVLLRRIRWCGARGVGWGSGSSFLFGPRGRMN